MQSVLSRISLVLLFLVWPQAWAQVALPFTEDFHGTTLNPAWQILPGQGTYTVGGGQLRYYNDGPVASTTGWYYPALTLALRFTGTNWKIETKATYSLEWCPLGQTYTGPPVPTPSCTSGAQGPEVLVKFKPEVINSGFGGPNYAGSDYTVIERVIDAYYGANVLTASYGRITAGNLLNPADSMILNNIAGGAYWYQIIRDHGTLTVKYSYDGGNYAAAFSAPLAEPLGSYNELLLGGVTYSTAGSFTGYSYVHITSLDVPPTITSLTATPNALWPPNHKMERVSLAVSASDGSDTSPTCSITNVTSNEPPAPGEVDWIITGPLTLNLRAERAGAGSGRVYTITVTCTNSSNLSASKTVTVNVPHDRR